LLQYRSSASQKFPAGLRRTDAAAESLEYGQTDRLLELPHAAAERRLPKHKRLGGAPKAPVVSSQDRIPEMLKHDRRGLVRSGKSAVSSLAGHVTPTLSNVRDRVDLN
jgi:hypothetical protein